MAESQPIEDFGDRRSRHRDAQQPRHPGGAHAHGIARRQIAGDVAQRTRASAADVEDELRRTFDRPRAAAEIDAALEAITGVADEPKPARFALDDRRAPERAFEKHGGRRIVDARVLAAHDAGEAQRLFLVADEQQIRLEIEHLPVEQRELFAGVGEADHDGAIEQPVVVGMQRLAEFQHHVVGDVDDGGDRADAAALDAFLHPRRRGRFGVDAFDDAAHEARARLEVLDPDIATQG